MKTYNVSGYIGLSDYFEVEVEAETEEEALEIARKEASRKYKQYEIEDTSDLDAYMNHDADSPS